MEIYFTNNFPNNKKIYIHATDTCYGFACRYDDQKSLQEIMRMKGRPAKKPFSLLFADLFMLKKFCVLKEEQINFIKKQTQPSSFILPKKNLLQDYFPTEKNICVRIENENFPVFLSRQLNCPVTSTSVNKSGEKPMYWPKDIISTFCEENITLINSGKIPKIPPSTIWNLTNKQYIKLR